jgi:hypothetical protein
MTAPIGMSPVLKIMTPNRQVGNTRYTFGYNAPIVAAPVIGGLDTPSYGWGEISSVTLPSGAQATYQYKLDGVDETSYARNVLDNHATRKELTYLQEYDGTSTPATEVWEYTIPPARDSWTSIIKGPDGGITKESFYATSEFGPPSPLSGLVYSSEMPDGTVVERLWANNRPYGATDQQVANAYVKTEFFSIRNAPGSLVKTDVKDYQYDKNGNLLRIRESDWRDYSSLHDAGGNPVWTNTVSVPFVRTSLNVYYLDAPKASESDANDPKNANVYNRDTSPRLRNAVKSAEVRTRAETGAVLSRTEFIWKTWGVDYTWETIFASEPTFDYGY